MAGWGRPLPLAHPWGPSLSPTPVLTSVEGRPRSNSPEVTLDGRWDLVCCYWLFLKTGLSATDSVGCWGIRGQLGRWTAPQGPHRRGREGPTGRRCRHLLWPKPAGRRLQGLGEPRCPPRCPVQRLTLARLSAGLRLLLVKRVSPAPTHPPRPPLPLPLPTLWPLLRVGQATLHPLPWGQTHTLPRLTGSHTEGRNNRDHSPVSPAPPQSLSKAGQVLGDSSDRTGESPPQPAGGGHWISTCLVKVGCWHV